LALALASLLTTESPVVLYRVYNIFLNIAETLNDITRPDENGGGGVDSLMAGVTDSILDTDDIDYETEHDSRYKDAYVCIYVGAFSRTVVDPDLVVGSASFCRIRIGIGIQGMPIRIRQTRFVAVSIQIPHLFQN
jgi:hypothetical protein